MIRHYDPKSDFEKLKRWFDARKEFGLEPWMLPDLGFVCEETGICFLVTTNSCVAWIAHWAVDPSLKKFDRDRVIHHLIRMCEEVAKHRGFRLLQTIALCDRNLCQRLSSHDFKSAVGDFTFYAKDLGA